MVDADTVVDPYSLNYLVGSFVEDKKVVGLCGETSLSNAKASWTTMIQGEHHCLFLSACTDMVRQSTSTLSLIISPRRSKVSLDPSLVSQDGELPHSSSLVHA
jgi:hypothetical protein